MIAHLNICEITTSVEGAVADFGYRIADHHLGDISAILEGICRNTDDWLALINHGDNHLGIGAITNRGYVIAISACLICKTRALKVGGSAELARTAHEAVVHNYILLLCEDLITFGATGADGLTHSATGCLDGRNLHRLMSVYELRNGFLLAVAALLTVADLIALVVVGRLCPNLPLAINVVAPTEDAADNIVENTAVLATAIGATVIGATAIEATAIGATETTVARAEINSADELYSTENNRTDKHNDQRNPRTATRSQRL